MGRWFVVTELKGGETTGVGGGGGGELHSKILAFFRGGGEF